MPRLSLDLNPEMKNIVETLAKNDGITEAEILRRSIALYWAVKKGMVDGEEPGMFKNKKLVARLVGL